MNKLAIAIGILFLLCAGLTVSMVPDMLSLILIILMCIIIFAGFLFGMVPCLNASDGFKRAIGRLRRMKETTAEDRWLMLRENSDLFGNTMLNGMFATYMEHADAQYKAGQVVSNIGDTFSDDMLSLKCWQSLCAQIPGTMTGLGLLGTFLGLILGISGIGFSSVAVALDSVESLLSGIELAFYTSVVGVILSILYNLLHRAVWNIAWRQMGLFVREFHNTVIPSAEEQERIRKSEDMKKILERLDRIPKNDGFRVEGDENAIRRSNEHAVMESIQEAITGGEFSFHLQPRCRLSNRKIVAAEALIRWNRPGIGLVSPGSFMPVIEKNGFIARLDQYIWDSIISMQHKRIESGERAVPVSVNISSTDILAFDVPEYLTGLLKKYDVPPVYLAIEISEASYLTGGPMVADVEKKLRAAGFKVIMDGFDGDFLALERLTASPDEAKLNMTTLKGTVEDVFRHAKEKNMVLLAEHIESMEQLATLRKCGCDEGQGYALYEPVDTEEFFNLFEKHGKKKL
ncbi:MAG: EAL domain-containing protein [Clostridia bacterium]|nr:EAL domain-containing protein [Clostridia bacterium]